MLNRRISVIIRGTHVVTRFAEKGRFNAISLYWPENIGRAVRVLMALLVLCMYAHPGQAQFDSIGGQGVSELDSSRGYWRLKTQAASRSTHVQFFDANHQLLYEENLTGQWIKLSRRNRKQFDKLLAQLVANQLLTTRIKTEILPPTPLEPAPTQVVARSTKDSAYPFVAASYRVHAYVNQVGKLHLLVSNPERLRYKIEVVDQRNRALYEEFSNHDQYSRRLDLSTIPDNSCQIIIHIDKKRFLYAVKRQNAQFSFSLQPKLVVHQKPSLEPTQQIGEQQFTPIPINL